ncbi:hypothetical protein R1flu_026552 [Riccia fluitans]|uniref:Squalene cyclase N-terminal domain-containing protein n=1 Tax=Riccia fluitans TaxID=41844 RepID=A0ABD1XGV3_9MARC
MTRQMVLPRAACSHVSDTLMLALTLIQYATSGNTVHMRRTYVADGMRRRSSHRRRDTDADAVPLVARSTIVPLLVINNHRPIYKLQFEQNTQMEVSPQDACSGPQVAVRIRAIILVEFSLTTLSNFAAAHTIKRHLHISLYCTYCTYLYRIVLMDSSDGVSEAIQHAAEHLLSIQRPGEHFWCAETEANSTITSEYVMAYQILGLQFHDSKAEKIVKYYRERQNPADGSWSIVWTFPMGSGSGSAS